MSEVTNEEKDFEEKQRLQQWNKILQEEVHRLESQLTETNMFFVFLLTKFGDIEIERKEFDEFMDKFLQSTYNIDVDEGEGREVLHLRLSRLEKKKNNVKQNRDEDIQT